MPSFRHAYAALTPDFSRANFAIAEGLEAESDPIASTTSPRITTSESPRTSGAGERRVGFAGLRDHVTWESRWRARYTQVSDPVRGFFKDNAGLLLVASAQAFFSLMNVAVKKLHNLDPPVSALELVFVRMLITYICGTTYMLYTRVPDPWFGPRDVRLLLFSRGFFGFFGLFGVYFSLQYLSLSDATVLTFLAPLCTGIAGSLLLKEKFTLKEALAGCCSLLGVVLIARPVIIFGKLSPPAGPADGAPNTMIVETGEKGTPSERLVAVGVALVGVLGSTGAYTSIRAIGKRAHPLHTMSWFSMLCIVVSATGMLVRQDKFLIPTTISWMALLLELGTFGFFAQILLTMGLQRETAGRGAMAVYTQIVFATILDRIFFHSIPSALSVTGTLIIMASALYVALTKEKEKKEVVVTLENMDELTLEEGLLERSRTPEALDKPPREITPSIKVEPGEDHHGWVEAGAQERSGQVDQEVRGSIDRPERGLEVLRSGPDDRLDDSQGSRPGRAPSQFEKAPSSI